MVGFGAVLLLSAFGVRLSIEGALAFPGLSSGDVVVEGPAERLTVGERLCGDGIIEALDLTEAFDVSGGSSGILLSS